MAAPAEEDFSALPAIDRLSHKLWKARVSAYEELTKEFRVCDPDDVSLYAKYHDHLPKMAADANAIAQESGLTCLASFVENSPTATRTREAVLPVIVEKCLGAARAGTKKKAVDVFLLYAEIDVPDPVVEAILGSLGHKLPKLVAAGVMSLRELVDAYGVRTFNVKPLVKAIPKMFAHTDKNVRAEASQLVVSMYRWMGDALVSQLQDLKPVQLKELAEQFEKLPKERPTQARLLRSQQAAAAEAAAQGTGAEDGADASGGDDNGGNDDYVQVDAFELADPVNLLSKMNDDLYTQLASTKWKDRKEALEALYAIANTPKLESANYTELVGALAKRINDANIMVTILAAQCIECIAKGIRSGFAQYREAVVPPMIEKLKEKKQNVIDALRNALDATFATVSLSDVVESIVAGTKHKNPNVRAECCRWLVRCLKSITQAPGKPEIKAYSEAMKAALDDSQADVRESASEALGTMMKAVGERVMLPFIDGMDKVKEGKLREYYDKAEVKVKATVARLAPAAAAPPPKKTAPPKKAPPPAVEDNADTGNPPSSAPPPRAKPKLGANRAKAPGAAAASAAKKPPASAPPPPVAAAAGKKGGKAAPDAPISYRFPPDDAQAQIEATFPAELLANIANSNWKTRLAGVESVQTFLQQEMETVHAELAVRMLAKKPGWKDNNFQVLSKVFETVKLLAEGSSTFSRGCGALVIPGVAEKLGDMKVKTSASECMVAMAEKLSLQFVFSQAYEAIKKIRAPKMQADALSWMQTTLTDFGLGGIAVRNLIDFLKGMLGSSNAAVRTNAIGVLGAIRMFAGPDIRTFVQDVTPALLTSIDAEFERVAALAPPQPIKGAAEAEGGADVMEELFPRVDISSQLTSKLFKEMGDAGWKVRKEALDQLHGIVAANKRLKPTLGNELVPALKGRLGDSNKSLVMTACEIIGMLAKGIGKPFEKQARVLLSPMLLNMNDAKAPVRAAVTSALDCIADDCSLTCILPAASTALEPDAPNLRKDLLKWLQERLAKAEGITAADVDPIIAAVLLCLSDRNAEVRKNAQGSAGELIRVAGFDRVRTKCTGLKGTAPKTVMPIIEGLRSHDTGGSSAAGSSAALPVPTAMSRTGSSRSTAGASNASDRAVSPEPSAAASQRAASPKGLALPSSNLKSKLALKRKGLVPPGSLRPPTTGAGAASAAAVTSAASESSEEEPPFLTSEMRPKDIRADKDRGVGKWAFEAPRKDLIQQLSDQMQSHVPAALHAQLFSETHNKDRDWLQAVTALDDAISLSEDQVSAKYGISMDDLRQRYIANLDFILKYLSIRLFDTGSTMLLKCLDLIEHLLVMLDEAGYKLSEYEAGVVLPYFIGKLGEKNDTLRARVRASMKQVTRIYPGSRLFNMILEHGLKSKNARTRSESLDELGALIKRDSLTVCTPQKALPTIAAYIGDRDAAVRNGAINAILQAYLLVGTTVYKYLGRLSEKDKSMLEERFRRNKPAGFDEEPEQQTEEEEPAHIFSFQKARAKTAVDPPAQPSGIVPPTRTAASSGIPSSGIRGPSSGLLYRHRQQQRPAATPEPPEDYDMDAPPQQHDPEPERAAPVSRLQRGLSLRPPSSFGTAPSESSSLLRRPSANTAGRASPRQFGLQLDRIGLPDEPEPLPEPEQPNHPAEMARYADSTAASTDVPPTPQMPTQRAAARPERRHFEPGLLASEITSGDSHRSIHVLKQLEAYLADDHTQILPHVNDLVKAITLQVHLSFTAPDTESQTFIKLCKHLMNCLVQLFSKREIATQVSEDCLHQLLKELLLRLLDQDLQQWETGAQLTRALNILMIRILDNSSRDAAFSALLSVLQSSTAMLRTVDTTQIRFQTKFAELVMKCVWKLTKTLQESIKTGQLNTPALLLNVHNFYVALPPAEWKRRVSESVPLGDMPQKTIKTILHEVKAAWGEEILSQMQLIPDVEKSYLYSYLSHVVDPTRRRQASTTDAPAPPTGQVQPIEHDMVPEPAAAPAAEPSPTLPAQSQLHVRDRNVDPLAANAAATASSDIKASSAGSSVHTQLSQIFMKISTSERTKQGIMELYEFQRDHPDEEEAIERFLKRAGTFQSYIRRTLANIAADRGETRASSRTPPISPTRMSSISSTHGVNASSSVGNLRRASTISESSDTSSAASALASGDGDAYRQRLQRLQQMFGYQAPEASAVSSPANSRPSSMLFHSRTPSQAALDPTKRASVPLGLDYQHQLTESPRPMSVDGDRAQTMADLRERLARMKHAVNGASAAAAMDVDDDDDME